VHVCAYVSEFKRRCVRLSVHLFCQGGGIFFGLPTCLYITGMTHQSNLICEHVYMHIRIYA